MTWLLKLKAWAIELCLLALAILSGLAYERHKGKVEGEQIAAGKAAQSAREGAQVATEQQAKAQQLPPGAAQTELQKEWSRD